MSCYYNAWEQCEMCGKTLGTNHAHCANCNATMMSRSYPIEVQVQKSVFLPLHYRRTDDKINVRLTR